MTEWQEQIGSVITKHREEVEEDLVLAHNERDQASAKAREAENRVAFLEHALALADSSGAPVAEPAEKLTLHEAMRRVLTTAPERMMRASELTASINRQHLYRMQDGRPVEKQQVHARVGHYPQMFRREGTFIKLL
jgi:pyruvate-formate lyase